MTPHFPRKTLLLATSLLAGLSLAACNPSQNAANTPPPEAALALVDTQPFAGASAPTASALPAAPPAPVYRVADEERYRYLDRAWYLNDAFGDAPPDYYIDYDGTDPWYWQSDDRAYRVVEWVGGYPRYYYYEPGEELPFLVRDIDYAYGYDAGRLVVVYDRGGQVLPYNTYAPRADIAGRYLARARVLREASQRDQREAVARAAWAERRQAIETDRARLREQQRQQTAWAAYHQANQAHEQRRWAEERQRREAQAEQAQQQASIERDRAARAGREAEQNRRLAAAGQARAEADARQAQQQQQVHDRREQDAQRQAQRETAQQQARQQQAQRQQAQQQAREAQAQRQAAQQQAHQQQQAQQQQARRQADQQQARQQQAQRQQAQQQARQAQAERQAARDQARAAQQAARPAAGHERQPQKPEKRGPDERPH